ncbi:hypothetical protein F933_00529 [Acinetobacter beijerinckii CIP 110307]|uniref:Uncharacterized protein n=1 Tax=Acinetobacter beijerinckii CIP 110307 TaxID=1217648 RepID=N9EC54_9GAMM|nr:hypothetical protein F933_00529 [Acinetobacter beijerinckii CIP 110307]
MAVRSSNDTINEINIPEQYMSKCSDEDSESSLSDGLDTVDVEAIISFLIYQMLLMIIIQPV